ncbi:16642_t:CDS:2, partial [Gigaspora rosea]
IDFLAKGCKCGCSSRISKKQFAELRESFQAFSKIEQDIFLMAQLKAMNGGSISISRCLKKKTRSNKRTFYHWDYNTLLCQETYLNMLGIGRTYFENIRNHLINNGLLSRIYGNIKRMPQWKTKMVIDKGIAEIVKNFLENYAEVYGLPSPGRSINRITQSTVFLPAEMKIQIMSPRTDLCNTCQHFRDGLYYNTQQEEEAKDLLKRFKEHLTKARLERNYYNKNTKLAEEQRKLVNQNYSKSKTQYCSIDATAHYINLFGIQDEEIREQINYVLIENEIIGKEPNSTFSMIFDGIKKLNKGEKHLRITCVPGHTKFKCDSNFGMIKKLYRRTRVDCLDHIVEIIKKSSPAGLNKAQCYEGGRASNLGTVKIQKVANRPFAKFNLLKIKKADIFEEIRALSILVLIPPSLNYKRQEYLYNNICTFVKDEYKNTTCPRPSYAGNK